MKLLKPGKLLPNLLLRASNYLQSTDICNGSELSNWD